MFFLHPLIHVCVFIQLFYKDVWITQFCISSLNFRIFLLLTIFLTSLQKFKKRKKKLLKKNLNHWHSSTLHKNSDFRATNKQTFLVLCCRWTSLRCLRRKTVWWHWGQSAESLCCCNKQPWVVTLTCFFKQSAKQTLNATHHAPTVAAGCGWVGAGGVL